MLFDIGMVDSHRYGTILTGHSEDFAAYLWPRLFVDPPDIVTTATGTIRKWPQALGLIGKNDNRPSKTAPGAPTPKGKGKLEQVKYSVDPFHWAEGVNHIVGKEMEQALALLATLSQRCGHVVMTDIEKEAAAILRGEGTAAEEDALVVVVIPDASRFNLEAADPRPFIEDAKKKTGGGLCVMGEDVALALTKNKFIIAAMGGLKTETSQVPYSVLTNYLRQYHGITTTYVGTNSYQDGAPQFDFDKQRIWDGVFYIGTANNLLKAVLNGLQYDDYYDKDSRTKYVRAALDLDLIVAYRENGVAHQNVLAP